jgi:hypothetical protein
MDADDIAYPRRLERQAAYLTEHAAVDVLGSAMLVFGSDGTVKGVRRGPISHSRICAHPEWGFRLMHPTWTGRTAWFSRHGYRPSAAEDQELLLRAYRTSRYANLADVLLGYRQDDLRLRRIFRGRREFTGSAVRAMMREGRGGAAISGVAKQLVLGLTEVAAIGLHVEDRALRQRAAPASGSEAAEWAAIWQQLGRA